MINHDHADAVRDYSRPMMSHNYPLVTIGVLRGWG